MTRSDRKKGTCYFFFGGPDRTEDGRKGTGYFSLGGLDRIAGSKDAHKSAVAQKGKRKSCLFPFLLFAAVALAGCGEPMFENAGSQASLLEDREACAADINNSPAANAYRQDPDAHPEYPGEVFGELNRCIERRGWKLVQSEQDQERLRDAIVKEARQQTPPASISDSKTRDSLVRAVDQRFSLRNEVKKD